MKYLNVPLRPIHNAPRTGEFIQLYGDSGYITFPYRISVGRWCPDKKDWLNHAGDHFSDGGPDPIFWIPLPVEPLAFQNTDPEPVECHLFTFLTNHEHFTKYVKIYGTVEETRKIMFSRFSDRWGFMYPSSREGEILSWGLTELK